MVKDRYIFSDGNAIRSKNFLIPRIVPNRRKPGMINLRANKYQLLVELYSSGKRVIQSMHFTFHRNVKLLFISVELSTTWHFLVDKRRESNQIQPHSSKNY